MLQNRSKHAPECCRPSVAPLRMYLAAIMWLQYIGFDIVGADQALELVGRASIFAGILLVRAAG